MSIHRPQAFMHPKMLFLALLLAVASCAPKEPVVLRTVNIQRVEPAPNGMLTLYADAIFYNPNAAGMKLKAIDIQVLIDGKETARIDHEVQLAVKPKAEFTVPLEVQLKAAGLLDTILGFFGGKDREIEFAGSIKIKVKGFPVRVPVRHKEKLKL